MKLVLDLIGERESSPANGGMDPRACPVPDPGFAGVTALLTFYEFIKFEIDGDVSNLY